MIELCSEQGTQKWFDSRKGKITASCASFALARRGTKGRRLYIERLADDIAGIPNFEDEEVPPWFAAGKQYESYAFGWYSWQKGVDVKPAGFYVHDEYTWLGASPDGFPPEGEIEIKYRSYLRTFYEHASKGLRARGVRPQIQTQLFVTDKPWCDYVNYWRDDANEFEKGAIERIYRDDAYIENTLLPAFVGLWDEVQALLKRRGVA